MHAPRARYLQTAPFLRLLHKCYMIELYLYLFPNLLRRSRIFVKALLISVIAFALRPQICLPGVNGKLSS